MPERQSMAEELRALVATARELRVSLRTVVVLVLAREVRDLGRHLRDKDRPSGGGDF